jgi:hypothetical protein
MPTIRRRKSKRSRVTHFLGTYLKFKAVKKVVSRTPLKWAPLVGAIGAAGAFAARRRGGSGMPTHA